MRTIFKYTLDADRTVEVAMPIGSKIIHVHGQNDEVCIWAVVDPDATMEVRKFSVYGTGHPMNEEPEQYVGSVHIHGDELVFHIFEKVML